MHCLVGYWVLKGSQEPSKPESNGAEQPMIRCHEQSDNRIRTSVKETALSVLHELAHTGSALDGNTVNTSEDC